ncbi:hypothetical protein KMAL_13070 [Novacetimonas maltaceti]|uniref:Uncharacterized protein n=1 Tax=Novacetimonas maltaceti TaxID=1203393 RepID=A0A2S3W2H9_9PROT|nr:hypothetical protein KMAL_13070 [Novacetimonas maltaceti]
MPGRTSRWFLPSGQAAASGIGRLTSSVISPFAPGPRHRAIFGLLHRAVDVIHTDIGDGQARRHASSFRECLRPVDNDIVPLIFRPIGQVPCTPCICGSLTRFSAARTFRWAGIYHRQRKGLVNRVFCRASMVGQPSFSTCSAQATGWAMMSPMIVPTRWVTRDSWRVRSCTSASVRCGISVPRSGTKATSPRITSDITSR